MEDFVDVEIDYARRNRLPGFLSESYSGREAQYTGAIGIPSVTVSPTTRITDAASLYTLGSAYTVAPEKIENFLADNWPTISRLLSDHGPWEGFNTTKQEVILFQTSAHTFSLILGLLGTASEHMKTYLDFKGLGTKLDDVFKPGVQVDMLSDQATVFAWDDDQNPLASKRDPAGFHVASRRVGDLGIAFVAADPKGVNLSGGTLVFRYRLGTPSVPAVIELKPVKGETSTEGLIPNEIFTNLANAHGETREVQILFPATPGLKQTKEIVVTFGKESKGRSLDISILELKIAPRS